MNWLKKWWKRSSYTEKIMYALVLVMIIGILTRWNYVWGEVGNAFAGLFPDKEQTAPTADGPKAPKLDLPEPPSVMHEVDKPAWASIHYWDKTDLTDTAWVAFPDAFTEAMAQWGGLFMATDDATISKAVKLFLDKCAPEPKMLKLAREKLEWVFYDPNSPLRNHEAHIAALEWAIASDKVAESDKIRPRAQLEMALKNRKGTLANDFHFTSTSGREGTLYAMKAPYILLFINNPGCPACGEYMGKLVNAPSIYEVSTNGTLMVLGVYADGDVKEWEKYATGFPNYWTNGIDMGQKIKAAKSYDLSVVPTLILLDKDKRVLLKDVRPEQVIEFFNKLQ